MTTHWKRTKNTAAGILLATLLIAAQATAQDAPSIDAPVSPVVEKTTTGTLTTSGTLATKVDSDPLKAKGIRFNFRKAPLDTVLDYLSKAAGLVIVREVELAGTVDVVCQEPLSVDEAIAVLDMVLNQKGYAAVRKDDRTLLILSRDAAKKQPLPVKFGSRPEAIPKNDQMVTQIIPVRYGTAEQIIANVTALLPSYATITANQSVNAIILTDTQSDIRRMAEIVKALDTSIADISAIEVLALTYADAKETASIINQMFQSSSSSSSSSATTGANRLRGMMGGMPGMSGAMGGAAGATGAAAGGSADALKTASRVLAIADERTNSLILSAPEETMKSIEMLVKKIDNNNELITEVRVFTLHYADATETAKIITGLFASSSSSSSSMNFGGMMRMMAGGSGTSGSTETSQRQKKETTVQAVADTRTNSIAVTAISDVMTQIALMIEKLDSNRAKEQKVFTYTLKYADPETVAEVLQNLFSSSSGKSTSKSSTSKSSSSSTKSSSSSKKSSSSSSSSSFGSI
jgi:type II secretory pathway component GspD/PulD (secretin)